MPLLGFFAGLLVFTIIVILLKPIGNALDRQMRRIEQISGLTTEEVDEELSKPFTERFVKPVLYGILKVATTLFPKTKKVNNQDKLERDLKLAGIKLTAGEFSAIRIVVVFTFLAFAVLPLAIDSFPPAGKLLIFLMGAILAVLVPRYYLKSSIKKRQEGIRSDLPDILDLISVSVEAGLGFDFALLRVVNRSKGPLSDELKIVYREIQMGLPRREALKSLGDRSEVEELKTFVSSVIQADQLGISIKNVLRSQSTQLRQTRRQRAEERAMKAPVKMILPLVIFIFPVIFIILLGPSVLEIAGTFGGMG